MLNALSKAFLPTLCNLRQRALRFSLLWQWLNRTVWKKSVKQSFITNAGFRVVLGSFGGALWDFLVALRSRHGHRAQGAAARHVSSVKDLGERVPHQNYFLSGGIPSPCFKFWTTTCERMVCRLYSIIFLPSIMVESVRAYRQSKERKIPPTSPGHFRAPGRALRRPDGELHRAVHP